MNHLTFGVAVASFGLVWNFIGGYILNIVPLPAGITKYIAISNEDMWTSFLHLVFIGWGGSLLYRNVFSGNAYLRQVGLTV